MERKVQMTDVKQTLEQKAAAGKNQPVKLRKNMTIVDMVRALEESVRNLVSLEAHASLDKSSICRNLLSILGIFCCRIFLLLLV